MVPCASLIWGTLLIIGGRARKRFVIIGRGAPMEPRFITKIGTVQPIYISMMYTPNVYTITLNEFLDDGNGNNLATPGSVTTLYEEYNTGWSTNSNGPFGRDLTLSASDLPTANGFTFLGWYVNPNTSGALRIVDAGGHVVGEPTLNTYHGNTSLYSRWESDTGPFNVTVQ